MHHQKEKHNLNKDANTKLCTQTKYGMWISIFGHYDNWDKIGDFLKNCVKAYDADNNVVDGNAEKLYYKSRKNKKSS